MRLRKSSDVAFFVWPLPSGSGLTQGGASLVTVFSLIPPPFSFFLSFPSFPFLFFHRFGARDRHKAKTLEVSLSSFLSFPRFFRRQSLPGGAARRGKEQRGHKEQRRPKGKDKGERRKSEGSKRNQRKIKGLFVMLLFFLSFSSLRTFPFSPL